MQTLVHCSFLKRSRRNTAKHRCTRKRVAPLSTAGVSDEVAQEFQESQKLEDVEEPMPARPATLKDPGTPDQLVMEQHSRVNSQDLRNFPSDSIGGVGGPGTLLCLFVFSHGLSVVYPGPKSSADSTGFPRPPHPQMSAAGI